MKTRAARLVSLVVAVLVSAGVVGAAPFRRYRVEHQRGADTSPGAPLFAFAPLNGAGMGTECANADITAVQTSAAGAITFPAVTSTRTSTAICTKADGSLTTVSANKPNVQFVPVVGVLGILVQQQTRNYVLYSSDLTQPAWTKSNLTCTLTATHPDPSKSASTCTATAANGSALQGITFVSAQRSTTVYLKRRTGVGEVDLTRDNGATWIDISASLTSSWVRMTPALFAGLNTTSVNPTVGIRLVVSGDAVDVALFQDEGNEFGGGTGGYHWTSPIETTSGTVLRTADTPSAANVLTGSDVAWTIAASVLPSGNLFASSSRAVLSLREIASNPNSMLLSTSTTAMATTVVDNGGLSKVRTSSGTVVLSEGVAHRGFATAVIAGGTPLLKTDAVTAGAAGDSGTGTGIITTQPAKIYLGNQNGNSVYANGFVWNICVDNSITGRCSP